MLRDRLCKLPCQLFQPSFSDIAVVPGAFIIGLSGTQAVYETWFKRFTCFGVIVLVQVLLSLCIRALQAELLSAKHTALGQSPERRASRSQMYSRLGSLGISWSRGLRNWVSFGPIHTLRLYAVATFTVLSMK